MWNRMSDDWTLDDHVVTVETEAKPDRISPERLAELAAEFRTRRKTQQAKP